ncbi:MAG TPA: amidohydrolase family protein, partial [Steroidobacteraceae bacterium]|nr:amidohydrolase family protein [Steroidobacteraceae bacterium]
MRTVACGRSGSRHSTHRLGLLVVCASFVCTGSVRAGSASPHADAVQAFTDVVLIDGTGAPAIEHATVVVRGDRIESAGPASTVQVPHGAAITDLHGKVLMPGLADMHVHLVGGWDGHAVDMLGYRRYLNALLYAGVTTVLDTGNVQPYIVQIRDEVAAGRLPGPRIYCVGALVDGADPVWPPLSYAVGSVGQVASVVNGLKRDHVDFIKAYVGLSHSVLERLVEEGRKVSLRVIIDQWRRNGSTDLVDDGIYGFAHLPTKALSPSDVKYMQSHRTAFISTLIVFESFSRRRFDNLAFLDDPLIRDTTPPSFLAGLRAEAARKLTPGDEESARDAAGRFHNALANAQALFRAGVLLTAGTDAAYPGDFQGEGLHHELELLVEAGLTPLEAISVATQNAAR